jgi:ATP-binding cassette, subfamily B, bacterial IrtB/YbtQ
MIGRLGRITDDRRALHRAVAPFVLTGVLQGIVFALLVPLLRALLESPVDWSRAVRWLAVLAAVTAAYAAVYWTSTLAGYAAGIRIGRELRHALGEHLARLPLGWFTTDRTGRLARTLAQSVTDVMGVPAHILGSLVLAVVTPATVVLATFFFDWRMAAAFLVAVPLALAVLRWGSAVLRDAHRQVDDVAGEAAGRVLEFAQAQAVLRSAGRTADGYGRLEDALRRQHRATRALLGRMVAPLAAYTLAIQAGFTAVLLLGVYLALGGEIGVAEVVALLVLATRFVEPLAAVADLGGGIRVADNALDRVEEVLRARPLPEPATPAPPPQRSDIELDRVTFAYGDRPVLRDVSLRVPERGMVALVGPSGSGKTTVTRLVARFWDVDAGAVRVGGTDVRDLAYEALMAQLSIVFQDVYLFDGTIEENVRLGRPEADGEALQAAARAARLDEVVARLPDGWRTRVGEGGVALSGGERQRVSIARALLKDAPIVLLDEATAALDPENEAAVAAALAALAKDRTVLVIAHRLQTVVAADEIVVLERGTVVERGRHAELLAAGGRYARFWAERRRAQGWRLAAAGALPAPTPSGD